MRRRDFLKATGILPAAGTVLMTLGSQANRSVASGMDYRYSCPDGIEGADGLAGIAGATGLPDDDECEVVLLDFVSTIDWHKRSGLYDRYWELIGYCRGLDLTCGDIYKLQELFHIPRELVIFFYRHEHRPATAGHPTVGHQERVNHYFVGKIAKKDLDAYAAQLNYGGADWHLMRSELPFHFCH